MGRLDVPSAELAKFTGLNKWQPKIGDFIIYHGWFRGWYGVVHSISGTKLQIIKEGLPKLLFCLQLGEYQKNQAILDAGRIINSRGGEYCVLQNGVFFID